jgi:hypothetical protein
MLGVSGVPHVQAYKKFCMLELRKITEDQVGKLLSVVCILKYNHVELKKKGYTGS